MALVDQQVGAKPLEEDTVLEALNREVVPVVRRLRSLVNERLSSATATIGDGVATAYVVEHAFATRDVIVSVYDTASFLDVVATVERTSASEVTVTFGAPPAVDSRRVLIRP